MGHFFPKLSHWLDHVEDPRNKNMITYSPGHLLWLGLFLFLLRLGSKRMISFKFSTEIFLENLSNITGTFLKKIAHPDTLEYFTQRLCPEQLYDVRRRMIKRLIRSKCLDKFRLQGYYLIAIDGTGHLVFKERHCPHCLTKKKDGQILYYYHNVLEAKLVTENGLCLSIETEFIENSDGTTKQDCELAAFYRLSKRLKKSFPQLKICLLLDALYGAAPVMDIAKRYKWRYIITFKRGSLPERYEEYSFLRELSKENMVEVSDKKITQKYFWVNGMEHKGNFFDVAELRVQEEGRMRRFVWLTNFKLNKNNIVKIAKGGRLRWKIENEGFNVQKQRGFNLEHPFSKNETSMKNFYLLLQIAHIITQIMEKGSLLKERILKDFGSATALFEQLLEDLRTKLIGNLLLAKPIQIRFSSFP
jgi:hypothetical protein